MVHGDHEITGSNRTIPLSKILRVDGGMIAEYSDIQLAFLRVSNGERCLICLAPGFFTEQFTLLNSSQQGLNMLDGILDRSNRYANNVNEVTLSILGFLILLRKSRVFSSENSLVGDISNVHGKRVF